MTARFWLFFVWFGSYLIGLGLVFVWAALGYTIPDALLPTVTAITSIYVPYLGPVVAFWFAHDVVGKRDPIDRYTYVVALTCSAAFNGIVIVVLVSAFFRTEGVGVIESTIKLAHDISTLLAFLVGPAIGFFFAGTRRPNRRAAPTAASSG